MIVREFLLPARLLAPAPEAERTSPGRHFLGLMRKRIWDRAHDIAPAGLMTRAHAGDEG